MITNKPVREALAAFAAPEPTPGGGSASALAAALGTSLLQMVAGLPRTRSKAPDERQALDAAGRELTGIGEQLTRAIDDDAAAYDRVAAAYRLPAATDDDKSARRTAIQAALGGAIEVPLAVMRLSVQALELAVTVAGNGQRAAASDVGVAVRLLQAGLDGARLNVAINLAGLADQPFVERTGAEAGQLAARGAALAGEARALLS